MTIKTYCIPIIILSTQSGLCFPFIDLWIMYIYMSSTLCLLMLFVSIYYIYEYCPVRFISCQIYRVLTKYKLSECFTKHLWFDRDALYDDRLKFDTVRNKVGCCVFDIACTSHLNAVVLSFMYMLDKIQHTSMNNDIMIIGRL